MPTTGNRSHHRSDCVGGGGGWGWGGGGGALLFVLLPQGLSSDVPLTRTLGDNKSTSLFSHTKVLRRLRRLNPLQIRLKMGRD